jgi:ribonuclease P protein component
MHVRIGNSSLPNLLISVRKRFGGAVSRNQARRRIRAIFRDLLPNGSNGKLILISIADAAGETRFNELRTDLTSALSKFGLLDQ